MSELLRELASFPRSDRATWRKNVEATLKGRVFEEALVRRTAEGLSLEPLYTNDDRPAVVQPDVPGSYPFVRGLPRPAADAPRRGWTRGVEIAHPDIERANAMLLADLDGGAERALVRLASASRSLSLPQPSAYALAASGRGGVWVDSADDVENLLAGVLWSLAPVSLIAPDEPVMSERLFAACAELRKARGHGVFMQLDLIRCATRSDRTGTEMTAWLRARLNELAGEARRATQPSLSFYDARTVLISTTDLRLAGADVVQELAAALGTFIATARALDGSGIDGGALVRASEFNFGVGSDFFTEIAKLRAFRRCLAVVLDTLEILPRAGDVLISATTAEETLAVRDVYVNLLRGTEQASAAVFGGADCVFVQPFDLRLQGGSALGRRLARNIQSLLAEESAAGAVADPGGGAFYVEHRTEQLAEAAWNQFVEWERAGGFFAACGSGTIRKALSDRWQVRQKKLRSRREPVLGVSVFPQANERLPAVDPFNPKALVDAWRARLRIEEPLPEKAEASMSEERHYLGEDFETLRAKADQLAAASSSAPAAWGLLLGAPSTYAARLDWLRDVLAAGGLGLIEHAADDAMTNATAEFRKSGATTAVIVAADALHESAVPRAATALKEAGARQIVLAGRPGDHEAMYRHAGVTHFLFAGADAFQFLNELLAGVESRHDRS